MRKNAKTWNVGDGVLDIPRWGRANVGNGAPGRVTNVNGVCPVHMPILCKSAHERHMN